MKPVYQTRFGGYDSPKEIFKRLTDEEIFKAIYGIDWNMHKARLTSEDAQLITSYIHQVDDQHIAQAQLKDAMRQFIEWGEEQCPHSMLKKQYCAHCWQELKDQVEKMK
jgi:hypothetical protein